MTEQSYNIDRLLLGTYTVDGAGNITTNFSTGVKVTIIRPQVKMSLHIVQTGTVAPFAQTVLPKSLMIDISDSPNFPNNRTFTFCPALNGDTLLFNGREYTQQDFWVRITTLTDFFIDEVPTTSTVCEVRLCLLQSA